MFKALRVAAFTTAVAVASGLAPAASAEEHHGEGFIQLGPRPFFLVEGMDPGP